MGMRAWGDSAQWLQAVYRSSFLFPPLALSLPLLYRIHAVLASCRVEKSSGAGAQVACVSGRSHFPCAPPNHSQVMASATARRASRVLFFFVSSQICFPVLVGVGGLGMVEILSVPSRMSLGFKTWQSSCSVRSTVCIASSTLIVRGGLAGPLPAHIVCDFGYLAHRICDHTNTTAH